MHVSNAVQNQANTYLEHFGSGLESHLVAWVSLTYWQNKQVGNMQISLLYVHQDYQEHNTRKAENHDIPRYKSQFKAWNERCCQWTEDTDGAGLHNHQYYRGCHRDPRKWHQKRKVPLNLRLGLPAHTFTMTLGSWMAVCQQLDVSSIPLVPLSWGRPCQHAALTNLTCTSLIRLCYAVFLGQLHRSCRLLQSLFQNRTVMLRPLLHKVAVLDHTHHLQSWVHNEVLSRASKTRVMSTTHRGAKQTIYLL